MAPYARDIRLRYDMICATRAIRCDDEHAADMLMLPLLYFVILLMPPAPCC